METGNSLNKPYIWLKESKCADYLPDVSHALTEPDGLLAIGGVLNPDLLLDVYRKGIFPWYGEGQPVMWWSPDPRCVLFPDDFRISRSLKKSLRKADYNVTFDQAFSDVVRSCAEPRPASPETWITQSIIKNYQLLHESGHAHSVECWHGETLVGGLYGIAIGKIFFGESMFSHTADASKICLAHLVHLVKRLEYVLIDCQVTSEHLKSLGAKLIPRKDFSDILTLSCGEIHSKPEPGWPYISDYTT